MGLSQGARGLVVTTSAVTAVGLSFLTLLAFLFTDIGSTTSEAVLTWCLGAVTTAGGITAVVALRYWRARAEWSERLRKLVSSRDKNEKICLVSFKTLLASVVLMHLLTSGLSATQFCHPRDACMKRDTFSSTVTGLRVQLGWIRTGTFPRSRPSRTLQVSSSGLHTASTTLGM